MDLEKRALETIKNISDYKHLPLHEALSKYFDIPYFPICIMTDSERELCEDIDTKPAVCITTKKGKKIFHKGSIFEASTHIVHEFSHIILDIPVDDPASERTVDLFTSLLIVFYQEQITDNRKQYKPVEKEESAEKEKKAKSDLPPIISNLLIVFLSIILGRLSIELIPSSFTLNSKVGRIVVSESSSEPSSGISSQSIALPESSSILPASSDNASSETSKPSSTSSNTYNAAPSSSSQPSSAPSSSASNARSYVAPSTPSSSSAYNQTSISKIVYVTRTGTKYHRLNCRHIAGHDIFEYSIEDAQKHYEPCKDCLPDD